LKKLALVVLILFSPSAHAQDKKPFRWGTDPTGGAPFVYQNDDGHYVGFEVELAEYLAKKLGREPKMVAGDWSNLPQQLDKSPDVEGGIDVVLNGYELQEDLAAKYASTRPYYVFRVVLMARKDNAAIRGWSDLFNRGNQPPKTVGVLGGTVAQQYLEKTFESDIDLKSNPDVANVIKLVSDKRLDATVQDSPAATHFLKEYADLAAVGEPVRPGFYVLYCRKSDAELVAKLDAAISDGIKDGTLQKIYAKYGLWTDDQERLLYWQSQAWPPPFHADADEKGEEKKDTPNPLPRLTRELVEAAWVTVKLSFLSFPIAMGIGLLVGVGRVYGPRWVRVPFTFYVEVIRGTPLLLQLFIIYYLIPDLMMRSGVGFLGDLARSLTPMIAGVLGLAINYSAYEAENYRAGLLAIPKGQMEAALALGLTRFAAIRRIIVPQAFRIVIPPVTNDFIALFKDTSACSIILVVELTRKYNELFNFNRTLIVELAFLTAGLYLLMSYPLSIVARKLEQRLAGPKGDAA
jgi:polar amino acid transport system substrate-binding protein